MGMPGPFELIIILVIVLLIFGGKRLKNIGNEVGGAIKGFKSSMKDTDAEKKAIEDFLPLSCNFCAALNAIFVARDVLPIEGRPAIIIKSDW